MAACHDRVEIRRDKGVSWPERCVSLQYYRLQGRGTKLISYFRNKFPVPDIPNEPYLLLCPHVTFLSLVFLFNAFTSPDLTPKVLYRLKIPLRQGQLRLPRKEDMDDVYLFRKPVRTAIGVELSDE
jgi:hypothetical protein